MRGFSVNLSALARLGSSCWEAEKGRQRNRLEINLFRLIGRNLGQWARLWRNVVEPEKAGKLDKNWRSRCGG